jgi:hypothetical protein
MNGITKWRVGLTDFRKNPVPRKVPVGAMKRALEHAGRCIIRAKSKRSD